MIFEMTFDEPVFDDLPPLEKNSDEIILLVMRMARGDIIKNRKYSHNEIEIVARKLVSEGYIRGTALDGNKCIWSRLTRRGNFWLDITERMLKSF